MYSFRDIPYAADWYRDAHTRFIKDYPLPVKKEKTTQVLAQGYRHTTAHGRVALTEAVFESGCGCVLQDVDGNLFLDMGSGIYVTNLGHAHPKVSEAVARHARSLMNCHDYMTPVKAAFLERLAEAVGGDLSRIHLYDNGTTAVEFGIRAIRAITGKHEIISCFSDHHGKTMGSAALGRISPVTGPTRLPGFYLVPRPDPYRPIWVRADGTLDTEAYLNFYDLFIKEATTGQVAAFILEPIQGWGGTIIPPDDFFPKLAAYCRARNILLMTDEILTGSGRTGKWLCTDHWGVRPDLTVLGKGLGNGFPMSALLVREEYAGALAKIGPSTTFGGNPMACAAGLATLEVIEELDIMARARDQGDYVLARIKDLYARHPIIGEVRGKGCLLGMEFVKDRRTKEPFPQACTEVYQECMQRKVIPGVPVIHLLRLAPQVIGDKDLLDFGLAVLDESIGLVEKRHGYA